MSAYSDYHGAIALKISLGLGFAIQRVESLQLSRSHVAPGAIAFQLVTSHLGFVESSNVRWQQVHARVVVLRRLAKGEPDSAILGQDDPTGGLKAIHQATIQIGDRDWWRSLAGVYELETLELGHVEVVAGDIYGQAIETVVLLDPE